MPKLEKNLRIFNWLELKTCPDLCKFMNASVISRSLSLHQLCLQIFINDIPDKITSRLDVLPDAIGIYFYLNGRSDRFGKIS